MTKCGTRFWDLLHKNSTQLITSTEDNQKKINEAHNCLDSDIWLKTVPRATVLTTAWRKIDDGSTRHRLTQKWPFIKPNLQCQLSATQPSNLADCNSIRSGRKSLFCKRRAFGMIHETVKSISNSGIWLLRSAHTRSQSRCQHTQRCAVVLAVPVGEDQFR